jgi:hypothetical protein
MKKKQFLNLINLPIIALTLSAGTALAGNETTTTALAETPKEDVISGILKLDFNSHFVSYGADVWSDGASLSEPTFNPNLELYFALPADLTLTLGTWWDVNSKNGGSSSPIGGRIQEVDVYAGLSYAIDKLTISATYQAWMYGSDTEDILDIKFAYDCLLAPSLTIHNRLDQGAAVGNEGTILVLGLSHGVEAGPVAISFPFNLAYFLQDDFHGGTDEGFGYASLGVSASLPLTPYIGDAYGDWSLNGGLTYYLTDDEIIPFNDEDEFLNASIGLAVTF